MVCMDKAGHTCEARTSSTYGTACLVTAKRAGNLARHVQVAEKKAESLKARRLAGRSHKSLERKLSTIPK